MSLAKLHALATHITFLNFWSLILNTVYFQSMHHANLLVGSHSWALSQIPESERIEGQDVSILQYDRMSIANVRALIHEASLRPLVREYRTFVLLCDSLLHEAQNALLKLFEEPNAHTVFYLIIPREDMLLPTLRSRLNLLGIETYTEEGNTFTDFRKLGTVDRLAMIAEKIKGEDVAWIDAVTRGFSQYAHTTRDVTLMKDALLLESYIHTTGASKKMLLEHIALTL